MKKSIMLVMVIAMGVLQLTAIADETSENEPGTYKTTGEFKGVNFWVQDLDGVLNYTGVTGSGVLKNDKDEIIAEGELKAVKGFIGLSANKNATFFYVPLLEKYSTPEETQKSTSQFATLRYSKDNRWQVMDTNFIILMQPGGFSPGMNLKPTASITRQSVIQLPAGSFTMFGYKIESKRDGATVKFSYGKVVATTDCTATELQERQAIVFWISIMKRTVSETDGA